MQMNATAVSLKIGNALKTARGFKKVDKNGLILWEKTTTNHRLHVINQKILPSGTNVKTDTFYFKASKTITKPDGTVFQARYLNKELLYVIITKPKEALKDLILKKEKTLRSFFQGSSDFTRTKVKDGPTFFKISDEI